MQVCSDFAVSALPATENFVVSRVISRFICDKRATWRLEGEKMVNCKFFFVE